MIPTSELDHSVDHQISTEYRANGDHNPHFNEHKDHHHPEGAEQGFTGNLELRSDEDVESDSTMSDIESEEELEDDEFVDHAEEVLDRQKHHEDIIGGVHQIHHHHHHHYHRHKPEGMKVEGAKVCLRHDPPCLWVEACRTVNNCLRKQVLLRGL